MVENIAHPNSIWLNPNAFRLRFLVLNNKLYNLCQKQYVIFVAFITLIELLIFLIVVCINKCIFSNIYSIYSAQPPSVPDVKSPAT